MSEQSYRDATTPERLQRWHGLLAADAHPGTAVETVYDEIADCLDHVTGWAAGVDAVERAYSPDNPPPDQPGYTCPCGTGEEPCPVDGQPACATEATS